MKTMFDVPHEGSTLAIAEPRHGEGGAVLKMLANRIIMGLYPAEEKELFS